MTELVGKGRCYAMTAPWTTQVWGREGRYFIPVGQSSRTEFIFFIRPQLLSSCLEKDTDPSLLLVPWLY